MQIKGSASRIAAARFEAAVTASAPMKDIVVRYSDFLMMMVQQSAGCNALHALEAEMCRWLLQTLDRSDGDQLPLTQELLSQMLGVRRTTLTLVARGLQTSGLIRYRRGLIDILDRRGLRARHANVMPPTAGTMWPSSSSLGMIWWQAGHYKEAVP